MKITINNAVIFDAEERTLSCNGKMIILSNPACRLLIFLLDNNMKIVSREEIFKSVWDDYGLTPSGHSLNKNISVLRRMFFELGENDILETIPKQGVALRAQDIKIHEQKPEQTSIPAPVDDLPQQHHESENKNSITQKQFVLKRTRVPYIKFLKIKGVIFIISSIITLCLVAFIFYTSFKEQHNRFIYLMDIDKCRVYYEHDVKKKRAENYFASVYAKEVTERCSRPGVIYYDDGKSSSKSGDIQAFVAMCSLNVKGGVSDCKNFVMAKIN